MNVGELKDLTDDELRYLNETGYAHPPIRVGDVVELASGSCAMTVSSIKEGIAHCVWFDLYPASDGFMQYSTEAYRGTFAIQALRKV